jgi:hypothetical protein
MIKNLDISLDIETLGIIKPEGNIVPIVSISAYAFDRTGGLLQSELSVFHDSDTIVYTPVTSVALEPEYLFSAPFNLLEQFGRGLQVDPDTATWWATTNSKNLHELSGSITCLEPLATTMSRLNEFLARFSGLVWAKSPCFDIALLRRLGALCGTQLELNFKREADVRTYILDNPTCGIPGIAESYCIYKPVHTGNVTMLEQVTKHSSVCDSVIQAIAIMTAFSQATTRTEELETSKFQMYTLK